MAPQLNPSPITTTTLIVTSSSASSSSTESAGAIIGSAFNAAGEDNSGLSQAQVGGLLGGIIAAIIVVVLIWYWATNTQGYLQYHNNRSYYHRRHGWPSSRRNRAVYEAEVSYDETEEETSDANASARSRRRRRQQYAHTGMTAEDYNAMMAAQMYAEEQNERARRRRPPGVAVANDFVLNPEPVRFPPTTRRTPYRHTAYPQYPGVRYSLLAAAFFCITTPALAGPLGSTYGSSGQAIVINNDISQDRTPCVDGVSCSIKPKNISGPRDKRGPPSALQYNRYKNINKSRPSQSYGEDETDKSANDEDVDGAELWGEEVIGKDIQKPPFSLMRDGTYSEKKTKQSMAHSGSSSGYGTGREYGYPNKDPEGSNKGSFWGNSDASAQRGNNCHGFYKDFDEASSHIEESSAENDMRATESATDPSSETHKFILKAEVPRNTAALKNGPKFAAVCVVTQLSQMCIAAGNAVCSSAGTLDTRDSRCTRACNCVRV